MNTERIKEILSSYREDRDDPNNPELAEAFEALAQDPELAAWFEQEQAFDHSFRGAMAQVQAPPMQDVIPLRPKKSFRYLTRITAMAATLLIALGISFLAYLHVRNQTLQEIADVRVAMAYFCSAASINLDVVSEDYNVLQQYMEAHGGETSDRLIEVFAAINPLGCKIVSWRERGISLYCFKNDQSQVVHAFVIPKQSLTDDQLKSWSVPERHYNLPTAGWIEDDTAYLLVGSKPDVDISPFLLSDAELMPRPGVLLCAR